MILRNIKDLVTLTAQKTELPEELVAEIIKHYFKWWRGYLENPKHPALTLPELGTVYAAKSQMYICLRSLISQLRKNPDNEHLKFLFRTIWNLKPEIFRYYNAKKRKQQQQQQ